MTLLATSALGGLGYRAEPPEWKRRWNEPTLDWEASSEMRLLTGSTKGQAQGSRSSNFVNDLSRFDNPDSAEPALLGT